MELMEVITKRRSVRAYKEDPIPEEKLKNVLEAVRWAPSWANTQCWEIIIVKEHETKQRLGDTLSAKNPAREAILQAPLTLVLLGIKGRAGFYKGEVCTDKGDWYMFDLGLGMQNLCLAAHAMGLGTVIVGYFDAVKAAEILQVPEGKVVVAMTPLVVPKDTSSRSKRKEIEEFVYNERYGRQ
jgi:nitroreductase